MKKILFIIFILFLSGCKRNCFDEIIPEVCTEIDELCEEDFIRMCELSCYEICPDIIDVTKVCDDNCDCDLNE